MAEKKQQQQNNAALVKQSVADVPEYLQKLPQEQAAGLENVERGDIVLPRLGLCQSGSPQRKRSDPAYIDKLEEGQFFNTATREVYGSEVQVVPLLFFKNRTMFGETVGGGVMCQSADNIIGRGIPGGECEKCPMQMFEDGKRPRCNQFYNFAALIARNHNASTDIVIVALKSSGLKIAKNWLWMMKQRRTHAYAGCYDIHSVEAKNEKGAWYVPVIENAEWVSKDTVEIARQAYAAISELQREGRLRADVEDLQPSTEERSTSDEAPF